MKAIVYTKYGPPDVLHLEEVTKPVPSDDEVLIKVYASSVNAYDWHLLTADVFLMRLMGVGLFKPKNTILGADVSGMVEAVGRNIKHLRPGDEVFGEIGFGCYAEYVCAPESRLALKPVNHSFESAAAVPMAALTALQGLRDDGRMKQGHKVLINGASGGVGTFAIQIARAFGAEVTAVCSTRNVEIARSLGAHHIIDYTRENFTQNGQQYDLIFGANGYQPLAAYKRALTAKGTYVMAGGKSAQMAESMLLGSWLTEKNGRKMTSVLEKANHEDLLIVKDLMETGKLKPVIDESYPLSETVEAFRYFAKGHTHGKVVITIGKQE